MRRNDEKTKLVDGLVVRLVAFCVSVANRGTNVIMMSVFALQLFMAAPTKNQKIEALVKLVQKRCRGASLPKPPQRTVFETLMYAALLENATFDKADLAYTVLENYYIDWNEIRVCSVRELADTLLDLPQPEAAAERVRRALQGIFEKMYMFDLEDMRKKGKALAEHIKALEAMSAGTPYMIQYTAQVALDGHLIPLDEASLRIMRRLGLSQVTSDGRQEVCLGLDRVILKKAGLTFAAQLHHFAAGFYDVPDSPELLSLLSAIDKGAVDRSWASPVLKTTPPVAEVQVPPPVPPMPSPEPVKPAALPKKATPATKPPKKSEPVRKSELVKPAAKTPGKSVSSSASTKKTPAKVEAAKAEVAKVRAKVRKVSVKKVPVKKAPVKKTLPKKLAKPAPTPKKSPAKPGKVKLLGKAILGKAKPAKRMPVKKTKGVSPSKALRKKKPK